MGAGAARPEPARQAQARQARARQAARRRRPGSGCATGPPAGGCGEIGGRAERGIGPRAVRHDLDIGIGHQQGERIVGLIQISLAALLLALLPPHLDDAHLGQQRVLDERIEHQETGVLLHEHVVDVVGLLLGRRHILGPERLEPHHVVAAGENLHQRGHQAVDGVGHVGRHRARAALLGRHVVAHVAVVVVHGMGALGRKLGGAHGGERIQLLGREHGLELGRRHSGHRWGLMLEGAGGSRLAPEPEKPGVVSRISSRVHPASARTKKPIAGRVPDRRTVREFQFRE